MLRGNYHIPEHWVSSKVDVTKLLDRSSTLIFGNLNVRSVSLCHLPTTQTYMNVGKHLHGWLAFSLMQWKPKNNAKEHSSQSWMPELITLTVERLSNKLSRRVVIETLVKKASRKYLVCKFSSRSGRVVIRNGSMMTLPSIFDPNQSDHNNSRSLSHSYRKDGFLVHFNYQNQIRAF